MNYLNSVLNYVKNNVVMIIIIIALLILNDALIYRMVNHDIVTDNKEVYTKKNILLDNNEEATQNTIKVDLKGYVKKPGVYEISYGTNVNELIKLAGGVKSGGTTDNINLSKIIEDQTVVFVSKKSELVKKNNESKSLPINNETKMYTASPENANKIDEYVGIPIFENSTDDLTQHNSLVSINNATKEELLSLSGIGESKADAIIEYRTRTPFLKIEDIMNVPGIGEALFDKIKDKITV